MTVLRAPSQYQTISAAVAGATAADAIAGTDASADPDDDVVEDDTLPGIVAVVYQVGLPALMADNSFGLDRCGCSELSNTCTLGCQLT